LRRQIRSIDELPHELPVFPLPQAVLFPRGRLPLNVFEPRYLSMVDDALAGDRLIGMIQPATLDLPGDEPPPLAAVGGAGRISAFQETDDGRYLIVLTGVCRFRVRTETTRETAYRTVAADWSGFAGDFWPPNAEPQLDRDQLLGALKSYLQRNGFSVDWSSVAEAPFETLINALSADCPFTNAEKQALVEALTIEDRAAILTKLLLMEQAGQNGGYVQ
jgi:uncharacterized protein